VCAYITPGTIHISNRHCICIGGHGGHRLGGYGGGGLEQVEVDAPRATSSMTEWLGVVGAPWRMGAGSLGWQAISASSGPEDAIDAAVPHLTLRFLMSFDPTLLNGHIHLHHHALRFAHALDTFPAQCQLHRFI
jgi:hypothetical protein